MEAHELKPGLAVRILENGKEIDRGTITKVGREGHLDLLTIGVKSQKLEPGTVKELALFGNINQASWRALFPDPMTRERSYSPKGQTYSVQKI